MVFLNSKVIKKKRICKKKKKNILKKEIVCVRLTTSLLTPGIYTVFPKGISISCYSQNVLLQGKCLYAENYKANKGPGK